MYRLHTVEELKAFSVDGKTVEEMLTELIAKIGENLNIRKSSINRNWRVCCYIYTFRWKIGVLIELDGEILENQEKARASSLCTWQEWILNTYLKTLTTDLEKEREIEKHNLLQEGKPKILLKEY